MDEKGIKETDIWTLYNKSVEFANKKGYYGEVDKCNNFYNGDQWEGLLIDGIEPVSLNFIDTIVDTKVSRITSNLRAINYSANNVDSSEFRLQAKKVCDLFNQRASRVWEKDQMDIKIKDLTEQAAINSESIVYVSYDEEANDPKNEILNKLDVYYGNENDSDIQNQPYILIKQRMSVLEAQELAKDYGVSDKEIEEIKGDMETAEEAGEDSKEELDNMVTVITKLYKSKGTVWYAKATKCVDIKEDTDTSLTLYPIAHMLWRKRQGSARGEGEVRTLIPNQIETNKTLLRRLLTAKNTAYPQKIYNIDRIENPEAIDTVGGKIEVHGLDVEDVNKAFSVTKPAQMSPDVEKLQNELITTTRELKNASNAATGQINPEQASGRAILAVQQASEQPLNKQNTAVNILCEDLARIWIDMWKTYNEGMQLEDLQTDPMTGEETLTIREVPASVLERLSTTVKIDITPKGAYDKYAQEISLENLAKSEFFMNTSWLEDYIGLLDSDSVMPKPKLEDLLKKRKEAQKRIREIQQQGAMMQQQVNQLMNTGAVIPREMEQYAPGQPEGQPEGQPVEEPIENPDDN